MTPERWQQIEALYHEAHALPADERAPFLVAACPNDDALRREVENLLSQPGSGDGFFAAGSVVELAGPLPVGRVGQTLGTYRLQELIGVGGMGEVYRAHDEKLGRQVAIKVLPQLFTSDAGRLARFEREARTLASLNHPNICAIHGFEEADDVRFLILELVDGATLDDRLAASRQRPGGSALSESEALNIARQIARALDYAHRRGIVHRDLKPANVKITSDGAVKVLDFGLAKAVIGDASDADAARVRLKPDATDEGTRTGEGPGTGDGPARVHSTIAGAIVGTPAYMSPEQARGLPIDKRADMWAFGCVLYEMLTGRATFAGATVADTIAAILEREPEWAALPPATPAPIRNLLAGCLAKDSQERLRDIGDVRITIDSVLSGSSPAMPVLRAPAVPRARPRLSRGAWLSVAALALVAAGVTIWTLRPQPPTPVEYKTIELDPNQSFDRSGGAHVASLSHDGSMIAYVASPRLLYLRRTEKDEGRPIQGTEAHMNIREPVSSPDDKEIAFYSFVDQKLKKMPVTGSAADAQDVTPFTINTPTGIDWSKPDIILYGQGRKGIYRITPNGGQGQLVAKVEKGQEAHGPHLLPDGEHFLFTIATGRARDRWDTAEIVVGSLKSGQYTPLRLTGSDARYLRSGHLVYTKAGRLYAVRFDPTSRQTQGSSVQVIPEAPGKPGVARAGGDYTGAAQFSVSDNGTLIYVPGPESGSPAPMQISLFDPAATPPVDKIRKLKLRPEQYEALRVSPDEKQIAFNNASDKVWKIYTYDLAEKTSTEVPLTTPDSNNRYPAWTHDSRRLAFQSDRGEQRDEAIWWQAANGSDRATRLTTPAPGDSHIPESWAKGAGPGDETLVYSITNLDGLASLATLSIVNGKWQEPLAFGKSTSTDPMSATFSPDGGVIAYTMTDRGWTTVCVETFPVGARDCLPPNKGDSPKHPRWSHDGTRLFIDPRIGDFESVPVVRSPVLKFGTREAVQDHPFRLAPMGERTPYDVTKTGKFLGLTTANERGFDMKKLILNRIQMITGWFGVLEQKVSR